MNQGRWLQGLSRLFPDHELDSQPSQLAINQGQKLLGGVGVALIYCRQDSRNFIHNP